MTKLTDAERAAIADAAQALYDVNGGTSNGRDAGLAASSLDRLDTARFMEDEQGALNTARELLADAEEGGVEAGDNDAWACAEFLQAWADEEAA